MLKLLVFVCTALVCAGSAASAQPAASFDPVASVRETLAKAGATEFFEIAPGSSFAEVRHRGSGLVCSWGPNDTVEITVFPESAGVPRGEDVGCAHSTPFGVHTIYATRYPPNVTARAALDSAVAGIKTRWPGAKAVRAAPASGMAAFLAQKFPPSASAQFIIDEGGRRQMTRVNVAQVAGWTIKARYSGQVGTDFRADVVWMGTLRGPLRARGLPPFDNGPTASAP